MAHRNQSPDTERHMSCYLIFSGETVFGLEVSMNHVHFVKIILQRKIEKKMGLNQGLNETDIFGKRSGTVCVSVGSVNNNQKASD